MNNIISKAVRETRMKHGESYIRYILLTKSFFNTMYSSTILKWESLPQKLRCESVYLIFYSHS